jgi:hypothetical protein
VTTEPSSTLTNPNRRSCPVVVDDEQYYHYDQPGECSECDGNAQALREYWELTSTERFAIWEHAQECSVNAANCAAGHAQITAKEEAGELRVLAEAWLVFPAPLTVGADVVEEVV